ncbi:MAG: SMI1/KNR4 family protein [Sphingobacteriales bacterium]
MLVLEKILSDHNFPKRTVAQAITFDEVEKSIKFLLPDDYKFYLKNFVGHECFVGPEYLRLWDFNDLLENNNGYGIIENLTNTLAIGGNGGGEFIAIEYLNQDQYRIVLSPFIDLNKQYNIEIGASFTDMLNRLNRGKAWFN